MDWISVKDRLPEEDNDFLTYGKNEMGTTFLTSDWFDKSYDDWWKHPHGLVTHWMPLPVTPNDSATYPQTIGNAQESEE